MKVLIHRKPLLEALELAREAVSKQTTLPILRNVKIKAEPESLYLYTTNLTTGIKTYVREATIIDIGTALCDATKLLSIVRELPDKEITLQTDGKNHLKVECESIGFKLISLGEEDFPGEINPIGEDSFPVGEEFFKAISKVRHAASKEESRYNLNVIYFDKDIVATDGHRLSLVKGGCPLKEAMIPLEFIPALLKMKRNGSQNISLSRSENFVFLCSEDLILHCRLIDGEFPDYSAVIPETHQRSFTMGKLNLYHAIKRILLMSDKTNQIQFSFSGNRVLLTSANPDAGEAREELEAHAELPLPDGLPFDIGFAGKYLLDVLDVLEGDQVTFLMNDPGQPLRIEEGDSTHIVMPIRLTESIQQEERKAA